MGFNGIKGAVNVPGMIPWEIVVAYFTIGLLIAFYIGKKTGGLKAFSTLDLVYIGIGAAFSVVWEFYIGSFIGKFLPSSPFIGVGFWGRLVITFIIAAIVRKVGVGMLTLFIFDLLADTFHYGFGGQPMFFIYESLTYGLFIDIMIAITGGKLFGIGRKVQNKTANGTSVPVKLRSKTYILAVLEGGVLGALWAIPTPIFYGAFFKPFIYGSYVNWGYIEFSLLSHLPGDIIFGIIAALISLRIVKAIGQ